MINIASVQPAPWPSPQAPSVAPVAGVTGVSAAHRSADEGRPGYGSGSDGRPKASPDGEGGKPAAKEKAASAAQGAPLLPRKSADGAQAAQSEAAIATAAKEQAREAENEEKANAEQKQNLLEVLSTVWKASAAVVEIAMGRESKAEEALKAEATAGVSQSRGVGAAASEPRANSNVNPAPALLGQGHPEDETVAYTDQGESAKVPQEPGKFVDQTV